jgi:sulfite dehydrogenase (cytochrome) subunit B
MKRIIISLACIAAPALALTVAAACAEQGSKSKAVSPSSSSSSSASSSVAQDQTPEPAMQRGSVRVIKLPEIKTELPPGPNRELVAGQCVVCHTLNYILIQPRFSKDTWTAEVTKMQKNYSAPIPNDKVPEIVDYLVAVRGQEAAGK